ncbi:MAG: hypothetical protein ACFFDW_14765 [Candidatus Thorarchaeota archaeon]
MSLKQIWILQDTGTCLFHKKYEENANDENLISGFLSAVNSFVSTFGDEIKWIETNKNRFVFKMTESVIFVACTTNDENAILTYKRLNRISDHFLLMFRNTLVECGDPIPVDIFKKIAPTVNRIFALPEDTEKIIVNVPQQPSYNFDSPEARLISFIRYKRKVSISDIVHYLKITNLEASKALESLENQRRVLRIEHPDGSEQFGLYPPFKGAY